VGCCVEGLVPLEVADEALRYEVVRHPGVSHLNAVVGVFFGCIGHLFHEAAHAAASAAITVVHGSVSATKATWSFASQHKTQLLLVGGIALSAVGILASGGAFLVTAGMAIRLFGLTAQETRLLFGAVSAVSADISAGLDWEPCFDEGNGFACMRFGLDLAAGITAAGGLLIPGVQSLDALMMALGVRAIVGVANWLVSFWTGMMGAFGDLFDALFELSQLSNPCTTTS
jgi:hypothetical protein